jgi:hypothetical protein
MLWSPRRWAQALHRGQRRRFRPRRAPSPAVYKPLRPNELHQVMTDAIRAKRFNSA